MWSTLSQITQVLLLLCVLAAIVLWFVPVIQHSQDTTDRKATLQAAIAKELEEEARLTTIFESLRANPNSIEREARDTLNLGKPGEVIFRFDPYQPSLKEP